MPARKERTDKTAREMFLEHAEAFAVQHGRELIRQSLEDMLRSRLRR